MHSFAWVRVPDTSFEYCSLYLFIANEQRETFMNMQDTHFGLPHLINRKSIYKDILFLYEEKGDEILAEYPFHVRFEGELGVDSGGVSRDMFSAFFESVYECLFDGSCLLCPVVHPEMDQTSLSVIGRILSHAYMVTGILPNRIAFPCLAQCFLGTDVFLKDEILKDSFMDSISVHESNIIKRALTEVRNGVSSFSIEVKDELITLISRFNSRQSPTPNIFHQMVINIAKYEFITKPAAAILLLNRGIPKKHQQFWANMHC